MNTTTARTARHFPVGTRVEHKEFGPATVQAHDDDGMQYPAFDSGATGTSLTRVTPIESTTGQEASMSTENTEAPEATTPATTTKGRARTTTPRGKAAPAVPQIGLTAIDLQSESYTPAQLRKMLSTSKNADTVKLVTAELERRAEVAQQTARAKNTVAVSPQVAQAAQAVTSAKADAEKAAEEAVMAHLRANPSASAPQTFKATGVSYSRVRKIAEKHGHRFGAQDRAVARVLTAVEAKQLHALEEKMGASLNTLHRALRAFDAS